MENPKPQRDTARRRDQFVTIYAATGNASAAAAGAGYSPRCAAIQATRMLSNDSFSARVKAARELYLANQTAAFERQTAALRNAADRAILTLLTVLDTGKNELAKVRACELILDRAGHKPIDRVESKNEHSFQPADADEVDSRLDRIFAASTANCVANGDSSITH